MTTQQQILKPKTEKFNKRLDFYWQYTTLYLVVLLIYTVIRGTISEGKFEVVIYDPIVVLLLIFVVASGLSLLYNYNRKLSIIIGADFIIFKSRFREKKYTISDIKAIHLGREKLLKVRRGAYKIIKIMLNGKRHVIRIRPSSFWNEDELVNAVTRLKKAINK